MSREDSLSFEAEIPFEKQRQFAAPYVGRHSYFMDWLTDLIFELRRQPSPYHYATRVTVAKELLKTVNPEYPKAAETKLRKIMRNLFPYDRVDGNLPMEIRSAVAATPLEQIEIKKPNFFPLADKVVTNKKLVELRYKVMTDAFNMYAGLQIALLRELLRDEPEGAMKGHAAAHMEKLRTSIEKLKEQRLDLFGEVFPPEQLANVNDGTLAEEKKFQPREELTKKKRDVPQMKAVLKHTEQLVRKELTAILVEAREAIKKLHEKQKAYLEHLAEALIMTREMANYLDEESLARIEEEIDRFKQEIHARFAPERHLEAEVLQDLKNESKMFRSGLLG